MNQMIATDALADMHWPDDYTPVPYQVYVDDRVFEEEQDKLFRGPCWHLIGLEYEIPEAGDFVATYIGNTPVVYSRGP